VHPSIYVLQVFIVYNGRRGQGGSSEAQGVEAVTVEFGCKLALAWPYKRRLTGVIN
jgi:hypothetical protein